MRGKLALITGGSSGVGLAMAAGLARLGARIVLLSRDQIRAEQARRELIAGTKNERVELLPADLARPASVRRAVAELERRHRRLDVLANCAGGLFLRREVTGEGWEITLASEFLGHFLLTNLLLPLLARSTPARILTAAGNPGPLKRVRIAFEDLQLTERYNPLRAKLQAARAKTLFTLELARRLEGSGVTANVFNPGLVRSNLTRHLPWFLHLPASLGMLLGSRECRTGTYLASSPEIETVSGGFFIGPGRQTRFPYEAEAAERLWRMAEELTGLVR